MKHDSLLLNKNILACNSFLRMNENCTYIFENKKLMEEREMKDSNVVDSEVKPTNTTNEKILSEKVFYVYHSYVMDEEKRCQNASIKNYHEDFCKEDSDGENEHEKEYDVARRQSTIYLSITQYEQKLNNYYVELTYDADFDQNEHENEYDRML